MEKLEGKKMKELEEIKKSIKDNINTVYTIPPFTYGNYSDTQLKADIIPLLENAMNRICGFEKINASLDEIRYDIINPVNETIQKNQEKSKLLAYLGIFSGLVGVFLTVILFVFQNPKSILPEIKTTNATLVKEHIEEQVEEHKKSIENLKYEQKILITGSEAAMEDYYDDLKRIGYNNISKISIDSILCNSNSIPSKSKSKKNMPSISKRNPIPYIYYKTPKINNDIIRYLEKYSRYNYSASFDDKTIIALMPDRNSNEKYVKWAFKNYSDIELLIVLPYEVKQLEIVPK